MPCSVLPKVCLFLVFSEISRYGLIPFIASLFSVSLIFSLTVTVSSFYTPYLLYCLCFSFLSEAFISSVFRLFSLTPVFKSVYFSLSWSVAFSFCSVLYLFKFPFLLFLDSLFRNIIFFSRTLGTCKHYFCYRSLNLQSENTLYP